MTKEQAKTAAKATVQKLKHDYFITWAITIEMVASQIFGYWADIAPWLGGFAPYVQLGLIALRVSAIGYKFYRTNSIKIGGSQ